MSRNVPRPRSRPPVSSSTASRKAPVSKRSQHTLEVRILDGRAIEGLRVFLRGVALVVEHVRRDLADRDLAGAQLRAQLRDLLIAGESTLSLIQPRARTRSKPSRRSR